MFAFLAIEHLGENGVHLTLYFYVQLEKNFDQFREMDSKILRKSILQVLIVCFLRKKVIEFVSIN
jgi:hypothetical protein